ncbi:DUF6567 family protein [Algoriphagus sp. C2-6-M1]|uniref:DUF6567 family protein n=1 Tax=Algoriphagus persicinus TaxID=3108754 RepID=UPI002B37733C|nr:DUF6567 family protein [Algoriphagus sp. C2-6-M1]MEB2781514.1 DUF6567 family protein [Algoriphagus sp. C2-6-M1]
MKRILLSFGVAALLFSGCATHSAYTGTVNTHQTNVVLSENNYKVTDQVTGSAKATYVLGIGGLSKKSLVEAARQDMYSKANLVGGSKALVNETFDTKSSFFILFWKKQVTTSASVIEFTK